MAKSKYDQLREKVWGPKSVKLPRIKTNPTAKELLQGDGRFSAKVVPDKTERKPRYGKQEWMKELDDGQAQQRIDKQDD